MKLPIVSREGLGCLPCRFRLECGGPTSAAWSCEDYCAQCNVETCTRVCPRRSQALALAIGQVGTWSISSMPRFPIDESLFAGMPSYIPTIHHGSNVEFSSIAGSAPWAAIPLSKFFCYSRKKNALRAAFTSEQQLRKRFSLTAETNIVALGVGFDQFIEDYWRDNRIERLPLALRQMGVRCFIPPNFSMFGDAPRTQHLHNRKRSLICALRAAEADLGVIPYLSALTDYDWGVIESFLREHPEITHVAEEFQTGTSTREFGLAVIERIADLKSRLGRPLHPILIGARRFTATAKKLLGSFTLLDSTAFFDAQCRRKPVISGGRTIRGKAAGKAGRNFARSVRMYNSQMGKPSDQTIEPPVQRAPRERQSDGKQLILGLA